ncbi:unnamed protein product [Cyclocybe aegerita]|uniref:Uncharacterized protein n=1 Tax=Cyclocybe aegerita TaxID=1973307 RepID=A0A8S0WDH0_CYCAE|nr:unnamed protein product [Cyclocybe aegerita]
MQSFRASPWVTYDPSHSTRNAHVHSEDGDVDMDAPRISTLRDEATPPPRPLKNTTPKPKKRPAPAPAPAAKEADDQEDEEDQLIDELMDDDDNADLPKASPSSRSIDPSSKRKVSTSNRKPRKVEKKLEGERKTKQRVTQPTDSIDNSPMRLIEESSSVRLKKKVSPRKPPAIPRAKTKLATKQKSAIPSLLLEDPGLLSESYAGTAASSPVTVQFEQNSPEPENMPPSSPPALMEEPLVNLENVPIPVYPLPTKPFPVQPPPKIPTGFAPLLPLDKSSKKVRHWREANREIRGIAGGRWFTRSWVGDKESEYASFVGGNHAPSKVADDKASASGLAIPKLFTASISAPASTKALGKLKASSKPGSAATSATPSRAPSAVPEVQGFLTTSAVRAPTKMRISQQASMSEGADSEVGITQEA